MSPELQAAFVEELKKPMYDNQTAVEAFDLLHNGVPYVTKAVTLVPMEVEELTALLGPHKLPSDVLVLFQQKVKDQDRNSTRTSVEWFITLQWIDQAAMDAIIARVQKTSESDVHMRDHAPILTQFADFQDVPNPLEVADFNSAWALAGRSGIYTPE